MKQTYNLGHKFGQIYSTKKGKSIVNALLVVVVAGYIFSAFNSEKPQAPKEVTPVVKTEAQLQAEKVDRMAFALQKSIELVAKDPDAVKFRNQKQFSNGACVEANLKNGFGGYTGYKEYCYLTIKGKDTFVVN
jgi:hypothetical protein